MLTLQMIFRFNQFPSISQSVFFFFCQTIDLELYLKMKYTEKSELNKNSIKKIDFFIIKGKYQTNNTK